MTRSERYSAADYDLIAGLIEDLEIPSSRILFPHVRLKRMKSMENALDLGYQDLTKLLLDCLYDVCDPRTVLVPTFTYSFTDSGVYHRKFSRSEVGRFSEEVRTNFATARTPNPIFSVVDTGDYLGNVRLDHKTAFRSNSLFDHLHEEDCVIINVDLPHLLMTQVHYIEREFGVSYRYEKEFEGVVYDDERNWREVSYQYYVRDLDIDPTMDYEHREQFLADEGALTVTTKRGISASWISATEKHDLITEQLSEDETFLLEE